MTNPTTPPPQGAAVPDPGRFTFGVIYGVKRVLEGHGYGPFDGRQYVELSQHLLHFLYGTTDRCYGGTAVTTAPGVQSGPGDGPVATEDDRSDVGRTGLRQSRADTGGAVAGDEERWGMQR